MTADDDLYWYDDATYQQGIHFYYPRTHEIEWAFTFCLWFTVILIFLLPCCVAIHQCILRERIRKQLKERGDKERTEHADGTSVPKSNSDEEEQTKKNSSSTPLPIDVEDDAPQLSQYEMNIPYFPSLSDSSGSSGSSGLLARESSWFGFQLSTCMRLKTNSSDEEASTTKSSPKMGKTNNGDDDTDVLESSCSDYVNMNSGDQHHQSVNSGSILAPKRHIDILYGRRPWYCFYCSMGFFRKIRKCARWDREMEKILRLVLPYTARTIIEKVFHLLEAGVIGRLLATSDLTAYYIVDLGIGLGTMFLYGIMSSLTVLVSHAIGAKNYTLAGVYVQLSVLMYQILFLPILLIGWNRSAEILNFLGYYDTIAFTAQKYARFALLYEMFGIYDKASHYVLQVAGHETYSTYMKGVHSLVSFLCVLFVSNRGASLWAIGAVHLGLMVFFSLVNLVVILRKKWFEAYWSGMLFTNPLRELRPLKLFLRAALPLSCGYVIEYCEWDVLFIFAAFQGPAEVAVWGLLGHVWDVADDIVHSISLASQVRVAHLLGHGRPREAKYSSDKSLFMGVVSACVISAALGTLQNSLPQWLTNDGILQRMLKDLMPMTCLGVALLSFGSLSCCILCAQGRTAVATAVTGFGSLFITIPLASVSTFYFNYNLKALAGCLIIGYSTSGFFNSLLMLTSNWRRISKIVRRRTKHLEEKMMKTVVADTGEDGIFVMAGEGERQCYFAYDFDDLPEDGKNAY